MVATYNVRTPAVKEREEDTGMPSIYMLTRARQLDCDFIGLQEE